MMRKDACVTNMWWEEGGDSSRRCSEKVFDNKYVYIRIYIYVCRKSGLFLKGESSVELCGYDGKTKGEEGVGVRVSRGGAAARLE